MPKIAKKPTSKRLTCAVVLLSFALLLVYSQYKKTETALSNVVETKIVSVYRAAQLLTSDKVFAPEGINSLNLAELELSGSAMRNISNDLSALRDIADWYHISSSKMDDILFLYRDMAEYVSRSLYHKQTHITHEDPPKLSPSDRQKLHFIDTICNLTVEVSLEFIDGTEIDIDGSFKISSLEDYFDALHSAISTYIESEYNGEFSLLVSYRSILESLFD